MRSRLTKKSGLAISIACLSLLSVAPAANAATSNHASVKSENLDFHFHNDSITPTKMVVSFSVGSDHLKCDVGTKSYGYSGDCYIPQDAHDVTAGFYYYSIFGDEYLVKAYHNVGLWQNHAWRACTASGVLGVEELY